MRLTATVLLLLCVLLATQTFATTAQLPADRIRSLPGYNIAPTEIHYSGYVAVSKSLNKDLDNKLYYWFFEQFDGHSMSGASERGQVSKYPVVLWLNGGPVRATQGNLNSWRQSFGGKTQRNYIHHAKTYCMITKPRKTFQRFFQLAHKKLQLSLRQLRQQQFRVAPR